MNKKPMPRPDYLIGTFDWRGQGYAFSTAAPKELIRNKFDFDKDDPWNCVGQFLFLCRIGEKPDTTPLRKIIETNNVDEPILLQACFDLLGDLAGPEEILYLKGLLKKGTKNQVLSACWASQWTASLDLIPAMLQVLKFLPRDADKDTVTAVISNMLESESGDEELEFYDFDGEEIDYAAIVMERIDAIKQKWPKYDRFFAGKPLDIMSMIGRFKNIVYDMVYKEKVPQESLLMLRRWFESATGVDCQLMFNNKRFSPEAALEILETWFTSEPVPFAVGKKYFFGHLCK
jgi:hypothetical protein